MEMEFKDKSRRRKVFVALGLVLSLVAGGAAFFLASSGAAQSRGHAGPRVGARCVACARGITRSSSLIRLARRDGAPNRISLLAPLPQQEGR